MAKKFISYSERWNKKDEDFDVIHGERSPKTEHKSLRDMLLDAAMFAASGNVEVYDNDDPDLILGLKKETKDYIFYLDLNIEEDEDL